MDIFPPQTMAIFWGPPKNLGTFSPVSGGGHTGGEVQTQKSWDFLGIFRGIFGGNFEAKQFKWHIFEKGLVLGSKL